MFSDSGGDFLSDSVISETITPDIRLAPLEPQS